MHADFCFVEKNGSLASVIMYGLSVDHFLLLNLLCRYKYGFSGQGTVFQLEVLIDVRGNLFIQASELTLIAWQQDQTHGE